MIPWVFVVSFSRHMFLQSLVLFHILIYPLWRGGGGRGKARKLLHGILMDRYYYDLLELRQ